VLWTQLNATTAVLTGWFPYAASGSGQGISSVATPASIVSVGATLGRKAAKLIEEEPLLADYTVMAGFATITVRAGSPEPKRCAGMCEDERRSFAKPSTYRRMTDAI
jgi:hypothetical protein